jgi:hypothetical protein
MVEEAKAAERERRHHKELEKREKDMCARRQLWLTQVLGPEIDFEEARKLQSTRVLSWEGIPTNIRCEVSLNRALIEP